MISGIETLLATDEGWKPVTLVWPLERAMRFSAALNGMAGRDAQLLTWRFLLRQLERARTGEIQEGTWKLDAQPPV